MKILHVNTRDYGGAAIAAIRLHKALLNQGVDSSILFLERANPAISASYAFLNPKEGNINYLTRKFSSLKKKIFIGNNQAIRNNAKLKNRTATKDMFSFNPSDFEFTSHPAYREADIIHLHWSARFIDFKAFRKMEKPVIWTLHDMNPFTGGCHFSKGCKKYEKECKECPQLKGTYNPDYAWVDQEYKRKQLKGFTPVITAPSVWMKNCSEKSRLFGNFRHLTIPNSVDPELFKLLDKVFCRTLLNWPVDKKILLFVSEEIDNPRKGFGLLSDALLKINNPEVLTYVIGISGIPDKTVPGVFYQGRIVDERLMAAAYSAADAVVIPSREDNLPNIMLESLACGTPVIAFPVGGMPDVIVDGFNGLLAKEVTSKSMAESIDDFFSNIEQFSKSAISEKAVETFSPEVQSLAYLSLYQEILN